MPLIPTTPQYTPVVDKDIELAYKTRQARAEGTIVNQYSPTSTTTKPTSTISSTQIPSQGAVLLYGGGRSSGVGGSSSSSTVSTQPQTVQQQTQAAVGTTQSTPQIQTAPSISGAIEQQVAYKQSQAQATEQIVKQKFSEINIKAGYNIQPQDIEVLPSGKVQPKSSFYNPKTGEYTIPYTKEKVDLLTGSSTYQGSSFREQPQLKDLFGAQTKQEQFQNYLGGLKEQKQLMEQQKEYYKTFNTLQKIDYYFEKEAQKFPEKGAGSGGRLFAYAAGGITKLGYDVLPFGFSEKDLTTYNLPITDKSGNRVQIGTKLPLSETIRGAVDLAKDILPITTVAGGLALKAPLKQTTQSFLQNPIKFTGETVGTTLLVEGLSRQFKPKIPQVLSEINKQNIKITGEALSFETKAETIGKTGGIEIFRGEEVLKVPDVYQTTTIKKTTPIINYITGEIKYGDIAQGSFVQKGKTISQEIQFKSVFNNKLKEYQLLSNTEKGIINYKLYEITNKGLKFVEEYKSKDVSKFIKLTEKAILTTKYEPIQLKGFYESTFEQTNVIQKQNILSTKYGVNVKGEYINKIESNLFARTKKLGQTIGYEKEISVNVDAKNILNDIKINRDLKYFEIVPTEYDFVNYPVAEKNIIVNVEGKNVFATSPAISEVKQFNKYVGGEFNLEISKQKYSNLKLIGSSLDYGATRFEGYLLKATKQIVSPVNKILNRIGYERTLFGLQSDFNRLSNIKSKLSIEEANIRFKEDIGVNIKNENYINFATKTDQTLLQESQTATKQTIKIQRPETILKSENIYIPEYQYDKQSNILKPIIKTDIKYEQTIKPVSEIKQIQQIKPIIETKQNIIQNIETEQIFKQERKIIRETQTKQLQKQISVQIQKQERIQQERKPNVLKSEFKINFNREIEKNKIIPIPPLFFPSKKRPITNVKPIQYKQIKSKPKKESKYVIPDLLSVSITELQTGKEAVSPKLTPKIKRLAYSERAGFGLGLIPTEQQRTKARL